MTCRTLCTTIGIESAEDLSQFGEAARENPVAATQELLMEPTVAAGQYDLRGLRIDLLRAAVEIYVRLAYPSADLPEVVVRRTTWREDCTADVLLKGPPFERAGKASGRPSPIYALRLGNHRYPHMKLQIEAWPNEAGFLLSVNTHDQVTGIDLCAIDAVAFRDLQAENQRLKEAIESDWDHAGLPTFLRYLKDYIKDRAASSPGPADRFNNDPDSR
jgi:hypothetical protein